MIAPEVFNFPAPSCALEFIEGDIKSKSAPILSCIEDHHFNHLISVMLPDTAVTPKAILEAISSTDSSYYKLSECSPSQFVQPQFIEAFVKQGKTSALSIGTNLDTDDCMCVTSSGHLILTLNKVSFEELGLEGRPSFFCRKPPTRFVVDIDLKSSSFKPGKNNYERVRTCLSKRFSSKFNILIAWDPPDAETCPSSVAAYFAELGVEVKACEPQSRQHRTVDVPVPSIGQCDPDELLEFLGMLALQCDLNEQNKDSMSTYCIPVLPSEELPRVQVVYLEWKGFFTTQQVMQLFNTLRLLVSEKCSAPWVALHVQGFEDSPVSWGLEEHCFNQSGDNAYTLFLSPEHKFLLCKTLGARRKPFTKSRYHKTSKH